MHLLFLRQTKLGENRIGVLLHGRFRYREAGGEGDRTTASAGSPARLVAIGRYWADFDLRDRPPNLSLDRLRCSGAI
jgi:hypothetical protein